MAEWRPGLVFLDTEFCDFMAPDLISIGAVTEDGKHEFYAELSDYDKRLSSEFVRNVVEPLLKPELHSKTRTEASARFWVWIDELPYDEVIIMVDYALDWDLTVELLEDLPKKLKGGRLINFYHLLTDPENLGGAATSRFQLAFTNYFSLNPDEKQHHALADARANRHAWVNVMNWLPHGMLRTE